VAGPIADRRDAIVIKGKQLPARALGAKIESLRVCASRAGSLTAIPFQIDKYDKNGKVIPRAGPKAQPETYKGALEAADELVFMAHDMGAQSAGAKLEGCAEPVGIIATDGKSGAKGFAYLFSCTKGPPLSKTRYVRWDGAKRTVTTDLYRMGWQKKFSYYYDYISINNGPNILDRLKVRITVGLGKLRKTYSEENFIPALRGYNDGPVRVVYDCDQKLDLGLLGKLPVGQILYFYDVWAFFGSPLDSRYNPAVLGLDYDVAIEHDLALNRSRGYRICAESLTDCTALDGVMTDAKRALAKKQLRWGGVVGPEGANIIRLVPDPRLTTKVMGVFVDDDNVKDPPEYVPGSGPVIGFDVVDWKNVKAGIYNLNFYQYFMKQYSEKEFRQMDKIAIDPLKVEAK